MKNQRSNDEQITGKLHVAIYAHPTVACPDCNDPTTASSATVVGLDAARAWLEAHGGYAALKPDYHNGSITGWSVYRVYPSRGHRCAGFIQPI